MQIIHFRLFLYLLVLKVKSHRSQIIPKLLSGRTIVLSMSKLLGSEMRTATHHKLVVKSSFFSYCLEPLKIFYLWMINVIIEFDSVNKVVGNVSCKHIDEEILEILLFVFHLTGTFLVNFVVLTKLSEFVITLKKFSHLSLGDLTALRSHIFLVLVVLDRVGVGIWEQSEWVERRTFVRHQKVNKIFFCAFFDQFLKTIVKKLLKIMTNLPVSFLTS